MIYRDLNIQYTTGGLSIKHSGIASLDGCPEFINGTFQCSDNLLSSLVGGPRKVDGSYICIRNQLTNLDGAPTHISVTFDFTYNPITSLIGIHKIVKSCNAIRFDSLSIEEGGIGLLLIDGLSLIPAWSEPFEIISRYLGTGTKGMMECSRELKSKGYEDYAKL